MFVVASLIWSSVNGPFDLEGALYCLSLIETVSFPKKVTSCSITLPEIALIWASALIISWFHQVPTILFIFVSPLKEEPLTLSKFFQMKEATVC